MINVGFVMGRYLAACILLFGFSGLATAEPLDVLTGDDYPPFSYVDNSGQLKGIAVELAEVLFARVGLKEEIQVVHWPKAYAKLLKQPNVLYFSMNRSKARQKNFEWIGDVLKERIYLYQKRDRKNIRLNTIADARQYRVGGVKLWDTTAWLGKQGVAVLELEESWLGLKLIALGKLDLMAFTELHLAYESARYGLDPGQFMKAIEIRQVPLAFAMSKGSNPVLLNKLRKAFKKIRNNGEYQRIYDKYVYQDLYDKPAIEALRKPN